MKVGMRSTILVGAVIVAALMALFIRITPHMQAPVVFLIPNGFRGTFYLLEDPRAGVELKAEGGKMLVPIPKTGLLRVASLEPLEGWHKESAHFENGNPVPSSPESPSEVGLYPGETSAENQSGPVYGAWIVGTKHDYERHLRGQEQKPPELR